MTTASDHVAPVHRNLPPPKAAMDAANLNGGHWAPI
jgi:hypothetical protein